MATKSSRWGRLRARFLRLWRSETAWVRTSRDLLVAVLSVALVLGGIWVYSGQSLGRAPLVVVESGSMMHGPEGPCLPARCDPFGDPPFGRVGTIDPGDLVIVQKVRSLDQVATAFGSSGRSGYGGHGDVIVFERSGTGTPIIHRAMLLILAEPVGCVPNAAQDPCVLRIPETCDRDAFSRWVGPEDDGSWARYCEGSSEPIRLSLSREGLFLELRDYPCLPNAPCDGFASGFITKGDNNNPVDQPVPFHSQECGSGAAACGPIGLDRVIGRSRGEIPWFGMIKLALSGNDNYEPASDPTRGASWRIFQAKAPSDVWTMLFVAVGVLVAAPLGFDFAMSKLRERKEKPPIADVPSDAKPRRRRGRPPARKRT